MRKIMVLLAVGMIVANSSGCLCRRLCPWLDRGAACLPTTAPAVAPLAAATAPVATYWDPCQCAVITKPAAAPPMLAQPQPPLVQPPLAQAPFVQPPFAHPKAAPPIVAQPPPMAFTDPGCGFVAEPVCGEPYASGMTYGPILMGDYPSGTVLPGGALGMPVPDEAIVDPAPVEE